MVTKKRAEVSRLRGVESVMSQCGKFEINALVDREGANEDAEGWRMNGCHEGERDQQQLGLSTPCPEKKRPEYFSNNFDKFRHSFVIFGTNHPDTSLY